MMAFSVNPDNTNSTKLKIPHIINVSNLIIVIILIYFMIGVFPFTPIENDSIRISNGIQSGYLYGNYDVSYLYPTHSGTYYTANILKSIIGLSAFDTLSFLTAISMIVFIIVSSFWLTSLTYVPILFAFFSVILFQESWISGFYPNASMPAAAILAIALLLSTGNLLAIFVSGFLYALAFWVRFDAIFTGIAFIIILLFINRKGVWGIILFSLSSLVCGIILFSISGITIHTMIESYNYYLELIANPSNWRLTMEMYAVHFTLAVILLFCFGIYLFIQRKDWKLLSLSIISPIPVMAAYGMHVTSSKHLLYLIPFLAIPVSYSIQFLLKPENRAYKWILYVAIGLLILQYIFSPPYKTLNFHNKKTLCQSCEGILIRTADAERFRGNILYAPLYYNHTKSDMQSLDEAYLDAFLSYLSAHKDIYIISYHWTANEWLLYYLQENGYTISEFDMYDYGIRIKLQNNEKVAYLIRINPIKPVEIPLSVQNEILEFDTILLINIDPTKTNHDFLSKYFNWRGLENMHRFYTVELTPK